MKWLKILKILPALVRLRNPETWKEPSSWASIATFILSVLAAYYGLSDEAYEVLLAGVLGAISSAAGVLLPERGATTKGIDPHDLENWGFGDK